MIASLPMYERPASRAAHDRFWELIRTNLGYGPETLFRTDDLWKVWTDPDLILSQTCGMPFRKKLHGRVQIVGTPDFGVDDTAGYYHSVIVTRAGDSGDLRDYATRRFAFNDEFSQSGWAAPVVYARQRGVDFGNTVQTGSHYQSALCILERKADIAAIDAVTWEILRKDAPELSGLQLIAQTASTPGLPYITSLTQDRQAIFEAIRAAIPALEPSDRALLGIRGICLIPDAAYLAVENP